MAQRINPRQGGDWAEIARFTGTVTTSYSSTIAFPTHKYIKVVVQSVQNTTQTSETVLELNFNGKVGATDYTRRMSRIEGTGTLAFSGGDTSRFIAGVSNSQFAQNWFETEITGTTWAGWNKGTWRLISDYSPWAVGNGWVQIKSTNDLNSCVMRATAGTYNVEAVVYGHN